MTAAVSGLNIVVDEKPDPSLHEAIDKLLTSFNDNIIGPITAEPLAILVRDPQNNAVMGGLWGRSAAGWMYVELLVVTENLRRRGIGTQLVRNAEAIARKRGCIGCWLHTGSFQAPEFYEKLGFEACGAIPDLPPGHGTVFFSKRLDP